MFSIGELARRTGVKVPTIRYYEEVGLLSSAERSQGNQRRYGRAELERLAFIRHARDLGFAPDAIRSLIELGGHPERPCDNAHSIAVSQLSSVREKIARLRKLENELERITTCCTGDTIGDCYVIRSLSDHHLCESEHA